jgi:hypothetical protein
MDFVTLNLSYDLLTGYCIVIADRGAAPRKQNVNQNRICACRCNRSWHRRDGIGGAQAA